MGFKVLLICLLSLSLANAEWKPVNAQNSPDVDGLVAGLNAAGNKIFIGRQKHNAHAEQIAVGKLITTASADVKAGLTLECCNGERFFTEGIEYYAIEETCAYDWVPSSKEKTVSNAVQYFSMYTMYVGRIFAHGEMQVGKVALPHGIFYTHRGQPYINQPTYEVLTCTRIATPVASITEKPCPTVTENNEELKSENKNLMKVIATLNKLQAAQEAELTSKLSEISNLQDKLSLCESQKLF